MAKKNFELNSDAKVSLGSIIMKLRMSKGMSLRVFSAAIGIPPSNETYLEKGVNVPTNTVYEKIIDVLEPDIQTRQEMDYLYSSIRQSPPPDVCKILLRNLTLGEAIKLLGTAQLSEKQIAQVVDLFESFKN